MGLGRAFVSLGGDASSAFSNPGATGFIDRSEFTAFHTSLFMGTNYDCLALSHPLGVMGVFTVSAARLGTSSFVGRNQYNIPDQDITASDMLLGLSYGRNIGRGLAAGLTLKGVSQEIGSNSGYGFGLDLGLQYCPSFARGLILGMGYNDLIEPSIKLINIKDKYHTVSRYGLSYSRDFHTNYAATGVFEIEKITNRDLSIHPGLEIDFYKDYSLRFGLDHDRATFGGGIAYHSLHLDYAYEDIQYLGGSHRISLSISFGQSAKKAQEETIAQAVESEKLSWQRSLDQQKLHDFASYLFTADSLRGADRYQDALFFYERALGINETSVKARTMSDSMMTLIVANAALTASDQKREDLTSKRVASALEQFKAGHLSEAISEYELALEIDPTNKTVLDLLSSARATRQTELDDTRKSARSIQSKGDYSNALLEWNKVLTLEPDDVEAKNNIDLAKKQLNANGLVASAAASMNKGEYLDAIAFLEQAQTIRPNDSTIKYLLAESKAKAAPATNVNDIKSNPEHWAIYLKGLEKYQASDFKGALENWESLKQFYPNNPDLEKNISQARQRLSTEGGQD